MKKRYVFCGLLLLLFLVSCGQKTMNEGSRLYENMEEILGPREEILALASVEQKEGLARYAYVHADTEERSDLLELIYGLNTEGFVYAEPQPYSPPIGETMDMEKQLLLRAYLSLQTEDEEYIFQLLTQGKTTFLRIYEKPVFDFTTDGADKLQEFDPPYIQCPIGTVDVDRFEELINAMHNSTDDAEHCAEVIRFADMAHTVLTKRYSAELRFYLEKSFEKDGSAVSNDVSYTLELRYADVRFRVNTETGDCLRNDGTEELQTTLEPGDLMRAKMYWNTALN